MRWTPGVLFASSVLLGVSVTVAEPPVAVSPAGEVAAPCPTFSWSQVAGASGYELVVYELAADGAPGEAPVLRERLPAGTGSWTPPAGECLAPGGRYAWSLRVAGGGEEGWSAPALFAVSGAPSIAEVEAALATLRRHLAQRRPEAARGAAEEGGAGTGRSHRVRGAPAPAAQHGLVPGFHPLVSATAAAAPSLGQASLTVSDQIHLDADSAVFKGGNLFLWDDSSNLAVGRGALSSNITGFSNTAVGRGALENTTGGGFASGSLNTAVGDHALFSNTTGYRNTASGTSALLFNTTGGNNTASGISALRYNTTGAGNTASGSYALNSNITGSDNTASGVIALSANTTGSYNTASGFGALRLNTTGSSNTAVGDRALQSSTEGLRNVAIGYKAGTNVTGAGRDDNIHISNEGVSTDSNKIRIGTQGTQDGTFIAGIHGVTSSGGIGVFVNASGQLGTTTSAARFKEEVREVGADSELLRALRPVAFRYRPEVVEGERPLEYGLIAEEVAAVFPELVVYDEAGHPETVKYHLLSVLLVNELKKEHAENLAQRQELASLGRRLAVLEEAREPPRQRRAWFRRRE